MLGIKYEYGTLKLDSFKYHFFKEILEASSLQTVKSIDLIIQREYQTFDSRIENTCKY